jgi:hypothetical protein
VTEQISSDAERQGMLAALHALMVGTLSTLKRKGVLSGEEIDHLFEAGISAFERGDPDEVKQAAALTLQILQRSLQDQVN